MIMIRILCFLSSKFICYYKIDRSRLYIIRELNFINEKLELMLILLSYFPYN